MDGVTDRVIRTVPGVGDPAVLSGKELGLAVIDATTGERVGHVPLGGDPHGVTVRP